MDLRHILHRVNDDLQYSNDSVEYIRHMSVSQRKGLLTLCRVQVMPERRTTVVGERLRGTVESLVDMPGGETVQIYDLLNQLPDIRSPVSAGYLSMIVRSMDYTDPSLLREELWKGVDKELHAAVNDYRPQQIRWQNLFSRTSFDPILPGYPRQPEVYRSIRSSIKTAAKSLSKGPILYPDVSNKKLGSEAAEEVRTFAWYTDRVGVDGEDPSTSDLERIYEKTGIRLSGRTEVWWSMKYNDIKPRVYYRRGPDQYNYSCYVQEIFNVLVDGLSTTHRFDRFNVAHLKVPPGGTAFIYDYSAFTSTLGEIREFTAALADFLHGISIRVFDSVKGVVTLDLGEYLHSYNEHCNDHPDMDLTKLFELLIAEELPEYQNTCGMLGVPGNISSCTLLHGIHLAILMGGLDSCKVVGDDAIGISEVLDREGIISMLRSIGEIESSKMEFWKDEGYDPETARNDETWNYVKRPFTVIDHRIYQGWLAIFPPPPVLLEVRDPIHTLIPSKDIRRAMKKYSNMMLSFVLQFHDREMTAREIHLVHQYVIVMNQKRRIKEYERDFCEIGFIRPHGFNGPNPSEDLISTYWNRIVEIPETQTVFITEPRRDGVGFVDRGSAAIRMGRILGYVESTPLMRKVIVSEDPELFYSFISKSMPAMLNQYYISPRIPDTLWNLITSSATLSTQLTTDVDMY
jgi:hypothetical protein